MKKIPVIIDTDIGDDIDDTWALILALLMDELDIKLISVSIGDTKYKAKLVAKILERLKKTHIPIYISKKIDDGNPSQQKWVKDFHLKDYPGIIFDNEHEVFKRIILGTKEKMTMLCLGPMTTIQQIMLVYPNLFSKCRFISMAGAIHKGYINEDKPHVEYNVVQDIQAFRDVLSHVDNFVLAPLDVCRDIIIKGNNYKTLLKHDRKIAIKTILENYEIWQQDYQGGALKFDYKDSSTILYDLVPLFYLMSSEKFINEELLISVTHEGRTVIGEDNKIICLLKINDIDYFYDRTIKTLLKVRKDYNA